MHKVEHINRINLDNSVYFSSLDDFSFYNPEDKTKIFFELKNLKSGMWDLFSTSIPFSEEKTITNIVLKHINNQNKSFDEKIDNIAYQHWSKNNVNNRIGLFSKNMSDFFLERNHYEFWGEIEYSLKYSMEYKNRNIENVYNFGFSAFINSNYDKRLFTISDEESISYIEFQFINPENVVDLSFKDVLYFEDP